MKYKDRFTKRVVKTKEFGWNREIGNYINENIDDLEIIQIYTSQRNVSQINSRIETKFHFMYKIKERLKYENSPRR